MSALDEQRQPQVLSAAESAGRVISAISCGPSVMERIRVLIVWVSSHLVQRLTKRWPVRGGAGPKSNNTRNPTS